MGYIKFKVIIIIILSTSIFISPHSLSQKQLGSSSTNTNSNLKKFSTNQRPTINELSQYVMNVSFFKSNASLIAQMNVSYLNTENVSLNYLYFNLWPNAIVNNSLTVVNVIYNSQNLNYALTGVNGSFLLVNLTQNVSPGSRYNITLNFELSLPYVADRFGYQLTSQGSKHDLYALTNWYPILAVYENNSFVLQPYSWEGESFYSDMAYYKIFFKTDKNLVVASGGERLAQVNDSTYQYDEYTLFPAREISFIMSPDFEVSSGTANLVTAYSYYFPEDSLVGQKAVNSTLYALSLFSNIFTTYPYSTMSVVDFLFNLGGMEYSGLVEISDRDYNSTLYSTDYYIRDFESVLSHEISHDWNTYLVADNPYKEPWLDEAFAMYSTDLFFEFKYPNDQSYANDYLNNMKNSLANFISKQGINEPIGLGMNYWNKPGNDFNYFLTVYEKGCLFFNFLRVYLSNSTFFTFLKDYFITFAYKTVTGGQFEQLLEQMSSQDLTWLFTAFIKNSFFLNSLNITNIKIVNSTSSTKTKVSYMLSEKTDYGHLLKIPILFTFEKGNDLRYVDSFGLGTNATDYFNANLGNLVSITIDPSWIYLRPKADLVLKLNSALPTNLAQFQFTGKNSYESISVNNTAKNIFVANMEVNVLKTGWVAFNQISFDNMTYWNDTTSVYQSGSSLGFLTSGNIVNFTKTGLTNLTFWFGYGNLLNYVIQHPKYSLLNNCNISISLTMSYLNPDGTVSPYTVTSPDFNISLYNIYTFSFKNQYYGVIDYMANNIFSNHNSKGRNLSDSYQWSDHSSIYFNSTFAYSSETLDTLNFSSLNSSEINYVISYTSTNGSQVGVPMKTIFTFKDHIPVNYWDSYVPKIIPQGMTVSELQNIYSIMFNSIVTGQEKISLPFTNVKINFKTSKNYFEATFSYTYSSSNYFTKFIYYLPLGVLSYYNNTLYSKSTIFRQTVLVLQKPNYGITDISQLSSSSISITSTSLTSSTTSSKGKASSIDIFTSPFYFFLPIIIFTIIKRRKGLKK